MKMSITPLFHNKKVVTGSGPLIFRRHPALLMEHTETASEEKQVPQQTEPDKDEHENTPEQEHEDEPQQGQAEGEPKKLVCHHLLFLTSFLQTQAQKKRMRKRAQKAAAKEAQKEGAATVEAASSVPSELPLLPYPKRTGQAVPQTNPPTVTLEVMYPNKRYPSGKQEKHPDELYVFVSSLYILHCIIRQVQLTVL